MRPHNKDVCSNSETPKKKRDKRMKRNVSDILKERMPVSFWEKMDKRARVPEMQQDLLQSRGTVNDGVKLYSEEDNKK